MDVANAQHLERQDYEDDITPEAIARIRAKAKAALEGEVFTLVSSADPDAPVGADFRMQNGILERV